MGNTSRSRIALGGCWLGDRELIEFDGDVVVISMVLDQSEVDVLRDVWFNKVSSCQPPLIDIYKNGFHLHIPWILKEGGG